MAQSVTPIKLLKIKIAENFHLKEEDDNKLYTFKECDYKCIWFALDIMVKQLDEKSALKNIPSARDDKKKNN